MSEREPRASTLHDWIETLSAIGLISLFVGVFAMYWGAEPATKSEVWSLLAFATRPFSALYDTYITIWQASLNSPIQFLGWGLIHVVFAAFFGLVAIMKFSRKREERSRATVTTELGDSNTIVFSDDDE